jgi:hypothetical protein
MLSSADSFNLTLVITFHLKCGENFMVGLDYRTSYQIVGEFVQEGASEIQRRGYLIDITKEISHCYYHMHGR